MEASKNNYKQPIDFVPREGSILSNLRGYLTTSSSQALAGRSPTYNQATSMDEDDFARRSAGPFIDALWDRIINDPRVKANHLEVQNEIEQRASQETIATIAKSLMQVFVSRKSTTPSWLNWKDQRGLVNSFVELHMRLSVHTEGNVQSYTKYWLDKILAAFMHDLNAYPPPKQEFAQPLLSGWCLRQVRRRLQRADLEFAYSLQKGAKQIWPELPESCLIQSLLDHRTDWCRDPTSIDDVEMVNELKSVSYEVFRNLEDFSKFCPRTTACSEFKCSEGGNLSLVRRLSFCPRSLRDLCPNESAKKNFESVLGTPLGLLRDINSCLQQWREEEYFSLAEHTYFNGPPTFLSEREEGSDYRRRPLLDVVAVAIPEPAKFRIISKGAGRLYLSLQPLQGAMLSAWKSHPTSTMLHDDLTVRVQEIVDRSPPDFNLFCSVDYKSATDKLKREATNLAISAIDGDWASLAQYSFLPGLVDYGRYSFPILTGQLDDDKDAVSGSQIPPPVPRGVRKEGQPMGHPLSFPCLCVINLACYRRALRRWCDAPSWGDAEWDRRQSLFDLLSNNVIINGDDMLFRGSSELYAYFCEEVGKVGFVFSAGKNYLSATYALINSQMFELQQSRVVRVRYLNQRLIAGRTGKTEGACGALPTQIAGEVGRMVAALPWARCVVPTVLNRWSKYSQKAGWMPNWYLPIHLGGYGLSMDLAPSTLKLTIRQRQFASYLLRNPRLNVYQDDPAALKLLRENDGVQVTKKKSSDWRRAIQCIPEPTMVSEEGKQGRSRWMERLSLAYQFSKENAGTINPDKYFRRWRKEYNLRPIGIHGLINHWTMGFVFPDEPPCPPLQGLHCPVHVCSWLGKEGYAQEWLSFQKPWGHRE